MGWAYGVLSDGREAGYSVSAICDEDGCDARIDRGLSYVCGPMHGGGDGFCGGYFCPDHLYIELCDFCDEGLGQVCKRCFDSWEAEHGKLHEEEATR